MRAQYLAGMLAATTGVLSSHAFAAPPVPGIEFEAGPIATTTITSGSVSILGLTATGAPLVGSATQAVLQLGGTISSSFFNPLGIQLTEFNLSNVNTQANLLASISGILSPGSSLSWAAYLDPANNAFGTPDLIASGTFTDPSKVVSLGFSDPVPGIASLTGPFSLTEILTASVPAGQTITFNSSITASQAVPEPGSLALLGVGLLGLGLVAPVRSRLQASA